MAGELLMEDGWSLLAIQIEAWLLLLLAVDQHRGTVGFDSCHYGE